jgi:uncharacterized protein (TIGR00369 family)
VSDFDPWKFFVKDKAPNSALHLGFELLDFDMAKGWIKIKFTPREEFLNPMGIIQGGFLIAMLDDTMGPATIVRTKGKKLMQTIDLHTHFLKPVRLGPITTEGTVIQLGRTIAYVEAKLFDTRGRLCARANSSVILTKMREFTGVKK